MYMSSDLMPIKTSWNKLFETAELAGGGHMTSITNLRNIWLNKIEKEDFFFIYSNVPISELCNLCTYTSCTNVTSCPSEMPSEPLWIYSIERTHIIRPVRGGASHSVVHKQMYLDRIAWSEEQDMWIAKEAERKWITFLTHVKANHRGASLAFPTAQIPAATVVFHLPVLVCTQAVRQPLNVFIYSEPLGEITVSCCPFFLQLSRWNLRE